MKVTINSVHFKADSKLEEFITNKIEKMCAKHNDVIGADVSLKLENVNDNENKIADIKLFVKGEDLFASKRSNTFEEAVDSSVEALKKQLEKYKGRFE